MDASDIEKRYSGGLSNPTADDSIGGKMSSVEIANAVLQNLFDNVSSAERATGTVEYRCFYFVNTHITESLDNAVVWIEAQTPSSDTSISIGLDPAGVGDGDTTGEATTIADETDPPSGVSFSEPATSGAGLSVGDLDPGDAIAVWVRRTVDSSAAAVSNDPFIISITGDPT